MHPLSDMTHVGGESFCCLLPLHTAGHIHTALGNRSCDIVCKGSAFVKGGFIDFPADWIGCVSGHGIYGILGNMPADGTHKSSG